ncbi:MAG: DNA mismatch endonuclease Vsr [Clostridia bacterium]|nr:DNA mismatch endonuclease Vsr [Clostridia bacterium]
MDNHTKFSRSFNMSQIKGKDTKPEVVVRKFLFSKGLRYRKNYNKLPGHPDVVFPKYRTVVFINGCFWHGHQDCKYSRLPHTNKDFWEAKINSNILRDKTQHSMIREMGWQVIVIWTCELKGLNKVKRLEQLYLDIINNSMNGGN